MQSRRIIAVLVVVVVILLVALLIRGCERSHARNALRDYSASVDSLIARSDSTGRVMFKDLKATATSGASTIQNQLNGALQQAKSQLSDAQAMGAPGQMNEAQQNLVALMTMRRDGIATIAANIQGALGTSTAASGVEQIAKAGAYFYGSDVLYKGYVATEIARALNGAGIPIGGSSGAPINSGQFLNDLGWLNKSTVAVWIGATLPGNVANTAGPGTHGHQLNFVTANGTQLTNGGTATIPASPAPSFQLNITNSGTNNEYSVKCEVTVKGLSDRGSATIPETTPGQTTTCTVPLPSPPTPGTYTVSAEVMPVPGEKNVANNVQTFSITFN